MLNSIVRAGALVLLCLAAPTLLAQAWPTRPVRYIVPFPPAGTADILSRWLAEKLPAALGQSVIVENRAGAAGSVGTELVAKAPPDGYTILMGTVAQSISETLYAKLPFSFARDLAPVALVARVPNVMVVRGSASRSKGRSRVRARPKISATGSAPKSPNGRRS